MSTVISASTTLNTAYNVLPDTSGVLAFATGATPTTALTISSSQVVTFAQAPVLPSASIPQAALAANVAGNGPAFSAYANANQSITSSTNTKIQINTVEYDTAGAFDNTTNYRFRPLVAGYYQVNGEVYPNTTTSFAMVTIVKNGSNYKAVQTSGTSVGVSISAVVYLNGSTDYIELYGYLTGISPAIYGSSIYTWFQAAMIRSA
jgi:hypothetical protein